jgi:hypothetical protein
MSGDEHIFDRQDNSLLETRDFKPIQATGIGNSIVFLLSDYYHFLSLVVFVLILWPVAAASYLADRAFRTQLVDKIILFCELF